MTLKENIIKLSSLHGASGFEKRAAEVICEMMAEYADEVYINNLGSVVGKIKGKNSSGSIMLEAHMDEVGLMVCGIDDDGFLKFTNIGGIDFRILPASEVIVHGRKDVHGIIGAKPPHLMKADEKDKAVKKEELFIDTGLTKDECEGVINVGDYVTFNTKPSEFLNNYVCAKSQDDRTSVAVIFDVLNMLKGIELSYDIYAVISVMEETNGAGAATSAYEINPDFCIVIDVTHGDTPDASEGTNKTGLGTVICKGPNLHPKLNSAITKAMDENEIKYNVEIEGGNTGTDAWGVQVTRNGIPCILLSIPLRYMHTSGETLCVDDAKETAYAIGTFLKSIDKVGDVLC